MAAILAACPDPGQPPQPNTQISRRCRKVCRAAKAFSRAIWSCGRSRPSTAGKGLRAKPSVQPAAPAPCARARGGNVGMASSAGAMCHALLLQHPHRLHRFNQVEAATRG